MVEFSKQELEIFSPFETLEFCVRLSALSTFSLWAKAVREQPEYADLCKVHPWVIADRIRYLAEYPWTVGNPFDAAIGSYMLALTDSGDEKTKSIILVDLPFGYLKAYWARCSAFNMLENIIGDHRDDFRTESL